MATRRFKELLTSLGRELSAVSAEKTLDSKGRRHWLIDQLDNYLDRWLGFAAAGVPMKSLLCDDLFTMLRAGVQVYSNEIKTVDGKSPEADMWNKFVSLISKIYESGDKAVLTELRMALTNVRKTMSS